MSTPDPLSRRLRADVAPERELGLRSALRRNKEQLFETLDAPVHPARPRTPYAMGALLTLGAAAAALLWVHERPGPTKASQAIITAIDVAQPAGPAAFDRRPGQTGERVALREGTLAFRTHGAGPKLRVVVPDGELEDVGTEFQVTVAGGRTVAIEVTQGLVVFHRHDAEDVRLPAGSTWHPAAVPAAASPMKIDVRVPAAVGSSARSAATVPSAPRPVASAPADTGEDAAYLRIVALVRENRRDEARVASQEYLRRFPNGFRRVEVEQLAR